MTINQTVQKEKALIRMGQIVTSRKMMTVCEETGKICYSRRDAGEVINSCKKHRNSDHCGRNKNTPRRAYFCRCCGCYHLTHKPFIRESDMSGRVRFSMADD